MNQIRPIAICVFKNNNRILVFEGYDSIKNETYYRPLGGGIEFGESGEQAVRREIREELHSEIVELKHLGFLENIFVHNGKAGHEIVMVYDGVLKESKLYEQAEMEIVEANGRKSAPCGRGRMSLRRENQFYIPKAWSRFWRSESSPAYPNQLRRVFSFRKFQISRLVSARIGGLPWLPTR